MYKDQGWWNGDILSSMGKTLCFSTCSAVSGGMEDFFPRQKLALPQVFYHQTRHVKILSTPKI
jgi:hypothetical protein